MKRIISVTATVLLLAFLSGCATGNSFITTPLLIENANVPLSALEFNEEVTDSWETISIPCTTLYVTKNACLRNIPGRTGEKMDSVLKGDEINVIGMVTTFNGEDCYFFLLAGDTETYIDGKFVTAR